MHFVEPKYKLTKIKWNWKSKIPNTVLERQSLCFSLYKNHKLKVKPWWDGACEMKKRAVFVYYEGIFF